MATDRSIQLAGVEVPRIGLGTNRLTNTPENVAFLRDAVAAGLRHVDTAYSYTGGDSERTIGAALGSAPEGTVVATKGGIGGPGRGAPGVLHAEIRGSPLRPRAGGGPPLGPPPGGPPTPPPTSPPPGGGAPARGGGA